MNDKVQEHGVEPDNATPSGQDDAASALPDASPAPASPPPAAPQAGSRLATPLAVLALLLALMTLVGGYFIWHELGRIGLTQQQVLGQVDNRLVTAQGETRSQTDRVDRMLTDMNGRLERRLESMDGRLETRLGGMASQLSTTLDTVTTLRAHMGRNEDGWILSEVQYLMRVANQGLQLEGDVSVAQTALENADARLRDLADPAYQDVRQLLADEIAALRAVAQPDIAGTVASIDSLVQQVDRLGLQGTQYSPARASAAGVEMNLDKPRDWAQLPGIIWNALRQLVDVRRHGQPVGPMLAPEEQYFLYQNLRLQLESSRVAALRREPVSYRAGLATARGWLEEHFDKEDRTRGAMVEEIARLQSVVLRPALPDIAGSLRLLRQHMALTAPSVPVSSKRDAAEQVEAAPQAAAAAAAPEIMDATGVQEAVQGLVEQAVSTTLPESAGDETMSAELPESAGDETMSAELPESAGDEMMSAELPESAGDEMMPAELPDLPDDEEAQP